MERTEYLTAPDSRDEIAVARRTLPESLRDLDDAIESMGQVVAALDERLASVQGSSPQIMEGMALRESERDDVRSAVVREVDGQAARLRDVAERARIVLSRIDL